MKTSEIAHALLKEETPLRSPTSWNHERNQANSTLIYRA